MKKFEPGTRYMTNKDRESILLLREKDLTMEQIGNILGRSPSTVSSVIAIYDMVKDGYYLEAKDVAKKRKGSASYLWACEKLGVADTLKEAEEQEVIEAPVKLGAILQPADQEEPKTETSENVIEAAIFTAARLLIEKQHDEMEAIANTICAKLERLATIIQSCTTGGIHKIDQVREESNANWDIMHNMVKDQTTNLELIKKNTRPTKKEIFK